MLSYFGFLCLIVLRSQISCAKSIQNNTDNNESLLSRMEKLETSLGNLEATVLNISRTRMAQDPVMFFAIINSKSFSLNTESTVVFETVVINEGNHYNNYDGVFVAPRDGIYLFSWTVSSNGANRVMTELVVDNKVISSTGERGADNVDYMSASMTTLCHMKRDNHAWIRTTGFTSSYHFYSADNSPRTSFLGLLIHADLSSTG